MRVIEVKTKKEMRDFMRLPSRIFNGRPGYIPPLWMDENTKNVL